MNSQQNIVFFSGWGESSLVPLVLDDACSRAEASTSVGNGESMFTEDMLCAGGISEGQVCSVMCPAISCVNLTLTSQVEHGGPLTVAVDGHHVVAGVSSWGLGCGSQGGRQFSVYAEVAQVDLLIQ